MIAQRNNEDGLHQCGGYGKELGYEACIPRISFSALDAILQ